MNNSLSTKVKPHQVIGGAMGWLDEIGFERESTISSVTKGVGSVLGDMFSLVGDITGDTAKEVPKVFYDAFKVEEEHKLDPFPSKGSIEFNKQEANAEAKLKQKEQDEKVKAFYQALKEDQLRAQQAKEKMLFEEELNDITANMSTAEKNRLLHYQASYKDKSIYQISELRKKIIEQRRQATKQEKQASIPSPAKQPSALEGAFEGRSGTQGAGTANLSAQATG